MDDHDPRGTERTIPASQHPTFPRSGDDGTAPKRHAGPARRTLLAAGAATAVALAAARPAAAAEVPGDAATRLDALERQHGARIGVFARNLRTGATVRHRSDERFPVLSVFKTLAAAAVLRDRDTDGTFLDRRIHYTEAQLVENSDVCRANLATGMTIRELCAAAVQWSDNTAGNLLLRQIGGPHGITRFARSLGDPVTRLDRWEPELNSGEPWRRTDTTAPAAIAATYARLVLGDGLGRGDREQLTSWLLGNRTGDRRLRAGLPPQWTVADKTGAAGTYASLNDVAVVWTEDGTPLVMAVLTTKPERDAVRQDVLLEETARVLADALR
ncbi:class A beta-lactamase [Streptomyces fragilis]|uniref:Beta-lactamase n=1 Tax=Streptomyces fragilis TaxID=67301 RepID=A0ABV2YGB0_9ACTN|nr:class A beta-lactamase [Streptomyces fragilis]